MGAIAIAKASDRVFERLVSGLEGAFGRIAAEGLARHFIEAEGADFYWEARQREKWIGTFERLEDDGGEALDRIAVFGFLDGHFYVAIVHLDAIVRVEALLGLRQFERRDEAERAYESMVWEREDHTRERRRKGAAPFHFPRRAGGGCGRRKLNREEYMSALPPNIIARSLTLAQRDLLLSGPLDFDEADTLPEGLFVLDCWLDENCEERLVWEITDLGRAVRAVVRRTR